MAKHGKKYEAALAKVDEDKLYTPLEACTLAQELASAKFDESIEVAFRLNIDTRQADQQVRGSISLPNGTGKEVRVAVFAEGDKAKEALEAGADVVGSDDLVADVQAGNINFDASRHDEQGWSSGQGPRSSRHDAQSQARHRHSRCRQGR